MERVWVVGSSGSGKTTTAKAIAEVLGLPRLELDGVYHQAGWTPLPDVDFRDRVATWITRDTWVVDGNYSKVADLLRARADTIVWLDVPRATVMRQVVGRTLRRVVRREELWNGNRERWRNLVTRNAEENVMLWAWRTHAIKRELYTDLAAELARGGDGPSLIRLTSRRAVQAYVASLAADRNRSHP